MRKDDLLEIGEAVRPHGLKGQIKIKSYLVSKETTQRLQEVFVGSSKEKAASYRVKTIRAEKKSLLLGLAGIENIDDARQLVGSRVFILRDELPKLAEDEYYWHELLDLDVETETGEKLGRITAIIPGAAHDIYVCNSSDHEIMVPAVAEFIRKIDIAAGIMVVALPEGL